MYGLISALGIIIRQLYLPNPFESYGPAGELYNMILSAFIPPISYFIVGLIYQKWSAPAFGSFLYTIVYSAIVLVILTGSWAHFAWWWWVLIITIPTIIYEWWNNPPGGR